MTGHAASGNFSGSDSRVVRAECDIPGLYVQRVQIGADLEPDMAILVAKTQDEGGEDIRVEKVLDLIEPGQEVTITVDGGRGGRPIFLGRILTAQIRAADRGEEIVYTALGLKHELMIEKLFGTWAKDNTEACSHLQAVQCVFNPDGKPNKNKEDLDDGEGGKRICFNHDHGSDQAELWTAGAMVRYCATAERKGIVGQDETVFDTDDQVGGELSKFKPSNVSVEGDDIWTAIVRIAIQCSHGVVFKYGASRDDTTLRFFPRKLDDAKQTKQAEFPAAGGPLSEAINDRERLLDSLDYQLDWAGMVKHMEAVAPPKVYEDEFTLLAGWKQEDEDAALGEGSAAARLSKFLKETDPETSSNWDRFKNVGRRWILNETGRDDVRDGSTTPYDFTGLFGSMRYAVRFRPFRRELATKDDSGQRKPPKLTIEFGGMPADVQLGGLVSLLEDRAGIYFDARPMVMPASFLEDNDVASLLPSDVRLTATVEGDQSSPYEVRGSAETSEAPISSFGLVRLDDGFRQDNVNADTAQEDAQKLVDEAAEEHKSRRDVGTLTSPFVTFQFEVGDVIDKIEGRDIDIKAMVMKVAWDFENQATELALEVPSLDTETHSNSGAGMQGAGVGASTDRATRDLRSLLGHVMLGHPVDRQMRDALGGYDPFAGRRITGEDNG